MMDKENKLAAALDMIRELLLGGAHEGPCTNEDDPYDSCDLHVAASDRRDKAAREFMGMPPREPS